MGEHKKRGFTHSPSTNELIFNFIDKLFLDQFIYLEALWK